MTADAERSRSEPAQRFRTLPPSVGLDETIATVDPDAAPDPDGGRNVEQDRALRDG